jgi:hypothetical protein
MTGLDSLALASGRIGLFDRTASPLLQQRPTAATAFAPRHERGQRGHRNGGNRATNAHRAAWRRKINRLRLRQSESAWTNAHRDVEMAKNVRGDPGHPTATRPPPLPPPCRPGRARTNADAWRDAAAAAVTAAAARRCASSYLRAARTRRLGGRARRGGAANRRCYGLGAAGSVARRRGGSEHSPRRRAARNVDHKRRHPPRRNVEGGHNRAQPP